MMQSWVLLSHLLDSDVSYQILGVTGAEYYSVAHGTGVALPDISGKSDRKPPPTAQGLTNDPWEGPRKWPDPAMQRCVTVLVGSGRLKVSAFALGLMHC
eukprot:CAMPEP_0174375888 /NCGR_PEP_ID=MMETSP0811_2-20130205/116170_1 /TAXON_ID=73025 ORGANISM="Eutreptiella gymnastica-like, Strain CCMP1594" /NCGR_SAMPLE_ID=MMETSP0811_2 /ASSEMBLY_ACC=CAM_ASM_000667 /LENGTH=98 /DNA_ID=CAMNT_0015526563 /DNA_START=365 /DNA_END=659 /DNA_ORIENTATION=+